MKTRVSIQISCLLIALMITPAAMAQEETLLGGGPVEHGGFGAPVVKYSPVRGEPAVFVGAYGGWLINHSFLLGLGGYGLVSSIEPAEGAGPFYLLPYVPRIQMGYGGLVLEYIASPEKLVHFSFWMLIGGGEVVYTQWDWWNDDWHDSYHGPADQFFVFEPGANVEVNVTSFFRVAAGASYRLVNGIQLQGLSNTDLSGPALNLALKFGSF